MLTFFCIRTCRCQSKTWGMSISYCLYCSLKIVHSCLEYQEVLCVKSSWNSHLPSQHSPVPPYFPFPPGPLSNRAVKMVHSISWDTFVLLVCSLGGLSDLLVGEINSIVRGEILLAWSLLIVLYFCVLFLFLSGRVWEIKPLPSELSKRLTALTASREEVHLVGCECPAPKTSKKGISW